MSHHWEAVIEVLRGSDPRAGAEVGTKFGRCSDYFLRAFPRLYMYAIDKWDKDLDVDSPRDIGHDTYTSKHWNFRRIEFQFKETMRRHKGRYKMLQMASLDAAKRIEDGSLDFVFIDAQHTYKCVVEDILAWRPKIKPGGWLTGHDYNHDRFPGVVRAVDELCDEVKVFPRHTVWAHREG